jgi:hypothetical protein
MYAPFSAIAFFITVRLLHMTSPQQETVSVVMGAGELSPYSQTSELFTEHRPAPGPTQAFAQRIPGAVSLNTKRPTF